MQNTVSTENVVQLPFVSTKTLQPYGKKWTCPGCFRINEYTGKWGQFGFAGFVRCADCGTRVRVNRDFRLD